MFGDERGSIIAYANGGRITHQINTYDAFGQMGTGNAGLFAYTGQIFLPEIGLYHYKARQYNPDLGRFLQTDPIGYEDQQNLYAYVANDPINLIDPSGEMGIGSFFQGLLGQRPDQLEARFDRMQEAASGVNMVRDGNGGIGFVPHSELGGSTIMSDREAASIANQIFPNAIGLAGGGVGVAPSTGFTGATVRGTGTLAGASRVQNIHPGNLIATHGRTLSNRQFARLKSDIRANGIQDPIKFATDSSGRRFVVDGHHRQLIARELRLDRVPAQEVSLPFRGFQSTDDLVPFFGGQ